MFVIPAVRRAHHWREAPAQSRSLPGTIQDALIITALLVNLSHALSTSLDYIRPRCSFLPRVTPPAHRRLRLPNTGGTTKPPHRMEFYLTDDPSLPLVISTARTLLPTSWTERRAIDRAMRARIDATLQMKIPPIHLPSTGIFPERSIHLWTTTLLASARKSALTISPFVPSPCSTCRRFRPRSECQENLRGAHVRVEVSTERV